MITLFISFHYACLFISKHLWLDALFVALTARMAPSSDACCCQKQKISSKKRNRNQKRKTERKKYHKQHDFHKQLAAKSLQSFLNFSCSATKNYFRNTWGLPSTGAHSCMCVCEAIAARLRITFNLDIHPLSLGFTTWLGVSLAHQVQDVGQGATLQRLAQFFFLLLAASCFFTFMLRHKANRWR